MYATIDPSDLQDSAMTEHTQSGLHNHSAIEIHDRQARSKIMDEAWALGAICSLGLLTPVYLIQKFLSSGK